MANRKKSNSKGRSSSSSSGRSSGLTKSQKRQAVAYAKSHTKGIVIAVCVILTIVIAAALIIYFFFPDLIKRFKDEYAEYTGLFYKDSNDDDPSNVTPVVSAPVEEGDLTEISSSAFSIHFLELGNKYAGDCTLIKCGNTEVLIDAGSRKNSAGVIDGYIKQYCNDSVLEYVIATHAHQDHIAGFVGTADSKGILYRDSEYTIGTIIQFSGHNTNSGIYKEYVAAVEYAEAKGAVAYSALDCWNGTGKKATQTDPDDKRSARRSYDLSAAGDGSLTLNVLYNYYYDHKTDDENDYSVCVLLTHTEDGNATNYLFTGDLEGKGEGYLVDYNELPEVELFKGGHHGSKTSSTEKLLSKIKPKHVAVCCCAGATEYTKNHDNTFPTQAFLDRICKYTDKVYVTSLCLDYNKTGSEAFTSMNGNIVFYYNEKKLKLWCSNNTTVLKDTQWFKENRKPWGGAGG